MLKLKLDRFGQGAVSVLRFTGAKTALFLNSNEEAIQDDITFTGLQEIFTDQFVNKVGHTDKECHKRKMNTTVWFNKTKTSKNVPNNINISTKNIQCFASKKFGHFPVIVNKLKMFPQKDMVRRETDPAFQTRSKGRSKDTRIVKQNNQVDQFITNLMSLMKSMTQINHNYSRT